MVGLRLDLLNFGLHLRKFKRFPISDLSDFLFVELSLGVNGFCPLLGDKKFPPLVADLHFLSSVEYNLLVNHFLGAELVGLLHSFVLNTFHSFFENVGRAGLLPFDKLLELLLSFTLLFLEFYKALHLLVLGLHRFSYFEGLESRFVDLAQRPGLFLLQHAHAVLKLLHIVL